MMYCQTSDTPSSTSPLVSTAMISAPTSVPTIEPDAADEAGAAENHRGDRVEFVRLAELQTVRRIQPGRRHHRAEPGKHARTRIDEHLDAPHLDAGQARRFGVAADRVDAQAEHRAAQDEPRDRRPPRSR